MMGNDTIFINCGINQGDLEENKKRGLELLKKLREKKNYIYPESLKVSSYKRVKNSHGELEYKLYYIHIIDTNWPTRCTCQRLQPMKDSNSFKKFITDDSPENYYLVFSTEEDVVGFKEIFLNDLLDTTALFSGNNIFCLSYGEDL